MTAEPYEGNGAQINKLATTETGEAYTYAELGGPLRRVGFTKATANAVPQMPQTVLISEKAH